ncbi:MAG: hypothetical protein QGD88_09430, partial [Anaerolineae bacterium]|nr:hypothetical protein [Anaerolineae bacterium]
MNKLNPGHDPQPKMWLSWLFLLVRWLFGGIVGYIGSFILILLALSNQGLLPILGSILVGQFELFNRLIFSIYKFFFNNYPSSDLKLNLSLIFYATLWGLIGALLLSGKKKQIKIGVVLLVIYLV